MTSPAADDGFDYWQYAADVEPTRVEMDYDTRADLTAWVGLHL